MLKFFRHMRKDLMEKNKTGKYFKYAIGEIILVMIGILLALQVNNWNEHKNNINQANKHLATIKLNLEDDIKQAQDLITTTEKNIEYSEVFLDQFKTIKPIDNNIQMYIVALMLVHEIEVNTNGFEALTNSDGMTYVNENIQVELLNYYRHIEQLKSREEISSQDIETMYEPYIKENYKAC